MWKCKKCHEEVEDSFAVCWNCGTSKEGIEDPSFRKADDYTPPRPNSLLWTSRKAARLLLVMVLFNAIVALIALLTNDRRSFTEGEVQRHILSSANGEKYTYELLDPPGRYSRWVIALVGGINVCLAITTLVSESEKKKAASDS
jgi:hypothetical protein